MSAMSAICLAFPDKGIEAPANMKAQPAVEVDCLQVGFSDGEAESGEVTPAQLLSAKRNQRFANAASAQFRQDADLGHVAHVVADARAQQQAGHRPRSPMHGHERCAGVKDTATGKADNVVQKT